MTDEIKAEKYTDSINTLIYDIEDNPINIARYLRKAYLDGLAEGRKESLDKLEEVRNLLTDIIEAFTSQSLTDDGEMADTAREIAEILGIKNYR